MLQSSPEISGIHGNKTMNGLFVKIRTSTNDHTIRKSIGLSLVVSVVLAGCVSGDSDLPELQINQALHVIDALSKGNSEEVYSEFSEDLQATLPIEELTKIWADTIDDLGEFAEVSKISTHPTGIREKGAVSVLLWCHFDRGNASFLMEVSEDGSIVLFSNSGQI